MYDGGSPPVREQQAWERKKRSIGLVVTRLIHSGLVNRRAMIAPLPTSSDPHVPDPRTTVDEGFARPPSALVERERLATHLALAVVKSRAQGRGTHALLTIDLDGFTRIEVSFGPEAAARLLTAVGHRLRVCLGRNDEMALVGTDEFNVLVECGGDAAEAWRVAELLLHQFTAPFALENLRVAVTAFIGVALVQPHHNTSADVVRDAYAAVYRAMSGGATRCALFDDGMHEAAIEQFRLATDLRHAIDRGEFRLHYQPILECRTGQLASLEALIRWEHPVRGCLPPSEFLEPLVHAGLMAEVGRWVIGEACRQSVVWRNVTGLRIPIAINVSPRQLADSNFVAHVTGTVRDTGACAQCIAFEMTEEIELENGETALCALRELRAAGFRVRIDDFGTGYSSLSYLQRLPIDGLKIDRAFIHHLEHDFRRREIVAAIIRMAHALDLDVVAEGVERRQQLAALRVLECDQVQGYYLSPPLAAAETLHWLESQYQAGGCVGIACRAC